MFGKCVILALVVILACARAATLENATRNGGSPRSSDDSNSILGGLGYVYKVYRECASNDLSTCLKLKLVAAIDRVERSYPKVSLSDGVSFVKEPSAITYEPPKSEAEIEAALPRSISAKDDALNSMIYDKVSNFLATHILQIKLPSANDIKENLVEEGRKKKKGDKTTDHMILVPMILGGTLIPLAIGGLALFAGKAMIVSVIALVLSSIIGIRKLVSGSSGAGPDAGHKVVVAEAHHDGYARALKREDPAQNLAYNAYTPKSR